MIKNIVMLTVILLSSLYLAPPVIVGAQVVFPVNYLPYTVALQSGEDDNAFAGEPYFIHLKIYPETLPAGYSISTLVDLLDYPAGTKPEVLPGFPTVQVRMRQAGTYRMAIRLSLISKSSCAGVDAKTIFEKELTIEVTER